MSPRLRRSRLHGSRLGSTAQVAVIALLVIAVLAGIAQPVQGAGPSQERKFDIRFTAQFNGGALASGVSVPTGARFSRLVIVAHNGHVTFWEESGSASAGVEELAEDGTYSGFEDEVNAAVAAGNARALETFPDHTGPTGGKEKRSFKVDGDFPLHHRPGQDSALIRLVHRRQQIRPETGRLVDLNEHHRQPPPP